MSKLVDLLVSDAEILELGLKAASIEGKGTPQEVSDRREAYIQDVLGRYFPYPYKIAKGNIIDSYGHNSASIDCLIVNPCHPYTVSKDNRFSILFADGVDFAIEVKPELKGEELERGLHQLVTVKELRRRSAGLLLMGNNLSEEDEEFRKTIPSFIFSSSSYQTPKKLAEEIVSYYEAEKIPQIKQFDAIVVNNKFLLINFKSHGYKPLKLDGLVAFYSERSTLAWLIFLLSLYPESIPRITENFISFYLNINDISCKYDKFDELTERLRMITE